jgi:hypothetical protein
VRSILAPVSAAGAALALLTLPLVASAQPFPNETIHGTVASWDGGEHLYVKDDRGFTDDIALGDQTAIRPAGTQLVAGMTVTITGYNAGHWFDAETIETQTVAQVAPPVAQVAPPVAQPDPIVPPVVQAPAQVAPAYPPPYPPYAYGYAYPPPVYYPYPVYYPAYAVPYYGYGPGVRVNVGWVWGPRGWVRGPGRRR